MWEHQCIFFFLCSFLTSIQNWPLLETKKLSLQSVVLLNTSSFTNQLRISLKILALESEEIVFNYKRPMVSCGATVLAQTPVDSSFLQHYTMRNTSHAHDNLGTSFLSELQTAGSFFCWEVFNLCHVTES